MFPSLYHVLYKLSPRLADLREEERPNAFLWAPVALGTGIGAYFAWPDEPEPLIWVVLAAMALAVAIWRRHNVLWRALFLVLLGFVISCGAARYYGTPMLEKPFGPAIVEGTIIDVEQRETGKRFLLDNLYIGSYPREKTPKRIHLVLNDKAAAEMGDVNLQPGTRFHAVAELMPLSEPLAPGGFDFRRNGFFQGLGGTGFILRKIEKTETIEDSTSNTIQIAINQLRLRLQGQIKQSLEGDRAGLAMILLTGDKTHLSHETAEAMRAVGLAHLLAIAGLHVGLVAGIVFFVVRFGLALFPFVALRYPIKKIAAWCALAAIIFYTLQVGAPVPTRRSLIMTGLVLIAVITDRASFSLHTIACAALVLLFFWPHLLLNPGFQLSFAAVTALIAAHKLACDRKWRVLSDHPGPLANIVRHIATLAGMSFVATFATLPASLFHFQEGEIYSILANTLAIPLTSLFLMPLCVFTDFLWPIGLTSWPLHILDPGLGLLIKIATFIAGLPGAFTKPPAMPSGLLVCAYIGGLSFCLMKTKIRWIGLAVMTIAIIATLPQGRPQILISQNGKIIGWATDDKLRLTSHDKKPDLFLASSWAPLVGLTKDKVTWNEMGTNLACDSLGCVMTSLSERVVWIKNPAAMLEECAKPNAVLINPYDDTKCADTTIRVIGKSDFIEHGAYALYAEENHYRIRFERDKKAARPWSLGWIAPLD